MTNPEKEFAKRHEMQEHEIALKEAQQKLEEAKSRYQKSFEEYHQLLEESKKYGSEVVDEAIGEYNKHLKERADNAWEGEQYDEAFALIEKMRGLEKNYPKSGEAMLTDEEERFVMDESTTFYDALPNNLKEGNLRFITNQFRNLALSLKKNGETIDDEAIEKISETVKERIEKTPSQSFAGAPFVGWRKKK